MARARAQSLKYNSSGGMIQLLWRNSGENCEVLSPYVVASAGRETVGVGARNQRSFSVAPAAVTYVETVSSYLLFSLHYYRESILLTRFFLVHSRFYHYYYYSFYYYICVLIILSVN